ncbi:unnamed protein product [Chrysoparadoxa australica]
MDAVEWEQCRLMEEAEQEQCRVDKFWGQDRQSLDEAEANRLMGVEDLLSRAIREQELHLEKQRAWQEEEARRVQAEMVARKQEEDCAQRSYLKMFYHTTSPDFTLGYDWGKGAHNLPAPMAGHASSTLDDLGPLPDLSTGVRLGTFHKQQSTRTHFILASHSDPAVDERVATAQVGGGSASTYTYSSAPSSGSFESSRMAAQLSGVSAPIHGHWVGDSQKSRQAPPKVKQEPQHWVVDPEREKESLEKAFRVMDEKCSGQLIMDEFIFHALENNRVKSYLSCSALFMLVKKREWEKIETLLMGEEADATSMSTGVVEAFTEQQLVEGNAKLFSEKRVERKFIQLRKPAPLNSSLSESLLPVRYRVGQEVRVLLRQGPRWYKAWIENVYPGEAGPCDVTYIEPPSPSLPSSEESSLDPATSWPDGTCDDDESQSKQSSMCESMCSAADLDIAEAALGPCNREAAVMHRLFDEALTMLDTLPVGAVTDTEAEAEAKAIPKELAIQALTASAELFYEDGVDESDLAKIQKQSAVASCLTIQSGLGWHFHFPEVVEKLWPARGGGATGDWITRTEFVQFALSLLDLSFLN